MVEDSIDKLVRTDLFNNVLIASENVGDPPTHLLPDLFAFVIYQNEKAIEESIFNHNLRKRIER